MAIPATAPLPVPVSKAASPALPRPIRGRAAAWSRKLKDIHEWLAEIGLKRPTCAATLERVTYHESCHLCHGQKITRPPRELLRAIPGLELVELPESNWCCGSAGIYNITQPEMAQKLLHRKLENLQFTGAAVVASSNPGCSVQLEAGLRQAGFKMRVTHPISLLAESFRKSKLHSDGIKEAEITRTNTETLKNKYLNLWPPSPPASETKPPPATARTIAARLRS